MFTDAQNEVRHIVAVEVDEGGVGVTQELEPLSICPEVPVAAQVPTVFVPHGVDAEAPVEGTHWLLAAAKP